MARVGRRGCLVGRSVNIEHRGGRTAERGEIRCPVPVAWYGGKRKVAAEVWSRFGQVANYVEPFFGSGAVLLGRPKPIAGNETVNDADGYIVNWWRAVKQQPEAVAEWADNPVFESDLHARHAWLLAQRDTLPARLEGDPDWCDPKIAGYWVWGISSWIGSGFCSGQGPWRVVDGQLVDTNNPIGGTWRQLVHLGNDGRGVNRQLVHLGDDGRGVNRQRVHLGQQGYGQGVVAARRTGGLLTWFAALSERLRYVRVCSGNWSRVCGPSVTFKHGLTAVFLDPPYGEAARRQGGLYRVDDSSKLSAQVREWAIEAGKRRDMRIALCGYADEHEMPPDWTVYAWDAGAGFGGQAKERTNNGKRERIWYSPACLSAKQMGLGF